MAANAMSGFIQHLRRTALPRDGAGLTDAQLLEDYVHRREQAALAALVRRHAGMVWGVCRRTLRNVEDAEDAFQATFLVLVRKAAGIVPREMVGNWLYGVAQRTALKARATAARRSARERQVADIPQPAAADRRGWHDLEPLLDEALGRLPERYRAVLVLCDLEGKARKEAARQLGCPEGTVAGRLARARLMLARRLTRRCLAVPPAAVAALLSQSAASAGAPAALTSSTIQAASRFAARQGAGAVSAKVVALSEGVLKTMLITKLKPSPYCWRPSLFAGQQGSSTRRTPPSRPRYQYKPEALANHPPGMRRSSGKRSDFAGPGSLPKEPGGARRATSRRRRPVLF